MDSSLFSYAFVHCIVSPKAVQVGYLNFIVIFICLLFFDPVVSLRAVAAMAVSFVFLLVISAYSEKNAVVAAKADEDMTEAVLEYARGLENRCGKIKYFLREILREKA